MNKSLLMVFGSSILLVGCFNSSNPVPTSQPVVNPPVIQSVDRPVFTSQIDEDEAFDRALGTVQADEMPQFVEVVDEGNADEIQGAEEGEKEALETDEDKEARAASVARGVARQQNTAGASNRGLEFRNYSNELYEQVKGVRPAILYFTEDECENCTAWEDGLRAEAEAFANVNALIILIDIKAEADLAAEMNVKEAGWGMMLMGIGELMGPRQSDRLTKEDLLFIFQ